MYGNEIEASGERMKLFKSGTNYKRSWRNFIINPAYQLRYVFWLSGSGLVLVALNGLTFYQHIKENYSILVELSPMTEESKAQLFHELNVIVFKIGSFSALFVLVVGIFGIIYSHRTVGPLYHFKRVFREIAAGNTALRVKLRKKDEFHDVAFEFNQMMDRLTNRDPQRDRQV